MNRIMVRSKSMGGPSGSGQTVRGRAALFVAAAAALSAMAGAASAQSVYTGPAGTQTAPTSGDWATGTNWVGGTAPASAATTTLDFGGSASGAYTSVNDIGSGTFGLNLLNLNSGSTATDIISANTSANTLTFNGTNPSIVQYNSGAFNISAPLVMSSQLTVTGSGTGAVTLSGPISGTGPLIFSNQMGTLNVTGANTYSGATNIVSGTVNFNGAASSTGTTVDVGIAVGSTASAATVNINTTGSLYFNTGFNVGDLGASGAVTQTAGVVQTVTSGGAYMEIGNGGYGSYTLTGGNLSSGTTSNLQGFRIGGDPAYTATANGVPTLGIYTQTGGSMYSGRYFVLGAGNGSSGSVGVGTFTGGTQLINPGYRVLLGDQPGSTGVLNLGTEAGGNAVFTAGASGSGGLVLRDSSSSLAATVNFNSGTMIFPGTIGLIGGTSGNTVLNLNGAVLQSGTSTSTILSGSVALPVQVYNGGVGFNVSNASAPATVSANLSSATGSGIYVPGGTINVPSGSGGSGYIGSPLVTVTSTNGITGTASATAIANVSNGTITGITLTNPGQGYAAGTTLSFAFLGGSPTVAAPTFTSSAVTTSDLVANGTGGLTKYGPGTLYLTGTNTYTGVTAVSTGVLEPAIVPALPASTPNSVSVAAGASLYLPVSGANQFSAGSVATVVSNTNFASGSYLGIDTNAGSFTYPNALTGTLGLAKVGSNVLTLSAANTYTGPTNVATGTLVLAPGSSLGNTAVTVRSGATLASQTGSGSINIGSGSATVTLANSSSFNMLDGAIGTTKLTGTAGSTALTIGSATGLASTLTFELGQTSADLLAVTGNVSTLGAGGSIVIDPLASDTTLPLGNIPIITAGAGLGSAATLTLATKTFTIGSNIYNFNLQNSTSTVEYLSVSLENVTVPTAYWSGKINNSWSTNQSGATNWATDATGQTDAGNVPGATTNVFFTVNSGTAPNGATIPANQNTLLGSSLTINSLTFDGSATAPVVIGGAGDTANTLTINALSSNGNNAGNGITMQPGAYPVTIESNIILPANQTWTTNDTTNPLIVNGSISGGVTLTQSGPGILQLGGNNTFSGGLNVGGGSLYINSPGALGTGAFTITSGVILDNTSGAPVVSLTNNPQYWNADFTFNGSSSLNMGSGTVTLGGTRNVTVNASTLAVGAVTDSGAGYNLNLVGPGNLAVTGTSSYNGSTVTNNGTLTFAGNVTLNGTGGQANVAALLSQNAAIVLSSGTLNIVGSSNVTAGSAVPSAVALMVGGYSGVGVVNISTTGTVVVNAPSVGGVANSSSSASTGAGAIYQTNGTVDICNPNNSGNTQYMEVGAGSDVSGTTGGYGVYNISGGTLSTLGAGNLVGIRVGASGQGIFDESGANTMVVMGRYFSLGLNGNGLATITGGTLLGSPSYNILLGDHTGYGTLNLGTMAGGNGVVVSQSSQGGGGLVVAAAYPSSGILNVNSGTLQIANGSITTTITAAQSNPYTNGLVNLNGGTIQAGANNLTLINNTFTGGTNGVFVYNGGAVFDTQTNTATITANLEAPAGYGVYPVAGTNSSTGTFNVPAGSGGSGYIGEPVVTVTGGNASGNNAATAVADLTNGVVTGITITSPGQGYNLGDQLQFSFTYGSGVSVGYNTAASTFYYTVGQDANTALNGTGGLTKVGSGTLLLAGSNTYTGVTTVSAGTLQFNNGSAFPFGGNLNVSNGATAQIVNHGSSPISVLTIGTLNVSSAGLVDITNNDLDIQNNSLASVTALVAKGYNLTGGGNWQGTGGITSSTAAANGHYLTAVGVIQNNQSGTPLYGNGTTLGAFDGAEPGAGDVLVKYTYFGDANLDGIVDGSDYSLIDAGYESHGALTGWYYGDFNYDGIIDGSDYALIDNAFNNQTGQIGTGSTAVLVASSSDQVAGPTSAVPEPASLAAASLAAIALIGRRRRR